MRTLMIVMVSVFFFCAGCVEETTENCDDACAIWAEAPCWELEFCLEECEDERDWDDSYLECLQAADSSDCVALEDCG